VSLSIAMFLNRFKSILIIIALCLVGCKRQNQRKTTNFLLETLNGQVKQLAEIWPCLPKDAKVEPNFCNTDTTVFNENGDPIRTAFVGGTSEFSYGRDSLGNKIEIRLDRDHSQIYTIAANGRILKYKEADFKDYTLYKYDNKGNVIESINHWFSSRDSKWNIDTTRYVYDNEHHLLEKKKQNKYLSKIVYEYKSFDSKHNWTKRVSHDTAIIPFSMRSRLRYKKDSVYIMTDTVSRKITYY
jgi:hypothetical protein